MAQLKRTRRRFSKCPLVFGAKCSCLSHSSHGKGLQFPDGVVAPSRFDVVLEIRAVGVSGRVAQLGKFFFEVATDDRVNGHRFLLRIFRVDFEPAMFDLAPGIGFSFEHGDWSDELTQFPVPAVGLAFPKAVYEYDTMFFRRPGLDPAVLIRVPSLPQRFLLGVSRRRIAAQPCWPSPKSLHQFAGEHPNPRGGRTTACRAGIQESARVAPYV